MASLFEATVGLASLKQLYELGYKIEREEYIGPDADVSKGKRTELVLKANSV